MIPGACEKTDDGYCSNPACQKAPLNMLEQSKQWHEVIKFPVSYNIKYINVEGFLVLVC